LRSKTIFVSFFSILNKIDPTQIFKNPSFYFLFFFSPSLLMNKKVGSKCIGRSGSGVGVKLEFSYFCREYNRQIPHPIFFFSFDSREMKLIFFFCFPRSQRLTHESCTGSKIRSRLDYFTRPEMLSFSCAAVPISSNYIPFISSSNICWWGGWAPCPPS
jgi:hypothetical protein